MGFSTQNVQTYVLPNGFTFRLLETPTETFAGELVVHSGALSESPSEFGYAHLLEHMVHNSGSTKITPAQAVKIFSQFGFTNAKTGLKRTAFQVSSDSDTFYDYVSTISDFVSNPSFDESVFRNETGRVLREISDKYRGPLARDQIAFKHAFFGQQSQHSYEVLGSRESVEQATKTVLRSFHQREYLASNMEFTLCGNLPADAADFIAKCFGTIATGSASPVYLKPNSPLTQRTILRTSAPDLLNLNEPSRSNAQLWIRMYAPTALEPDDVAALALNSVLGGDKHSRLFRKIGRESGLAYRINSYRTANNYVGYLGINSSIDLNQLERAQDLIFDEMTRLKKEPVSDDELNSLKRRLLFGHKLSIESNTGCVDATTSYFRTGISFEKRADLIKSLTAQEIQSAAVKYLPSSQGSGNYVMMIRDPLLK